MTPTYFSFFLTTLLCISLLFFFNDTATTEIYTLSLHDALPISRHERRDGAIGHLCARGRDAVRAPARRAAAAAARVGCRSEEHTSELQSPCNLVCRLLLEKKKKFKSTNAADV